MRFTDRLTELVERSESFRRIMADGVVEDREIEEQAQRVEKLLEKIEQKLSAEDFALVTELMAELSVLQVVANYNRRV